MYCRNCGEKIPEGSSGEFCGFCGERIDGTEPGRRHGKKKKGRSNNIIIAVLAVLLLCCVAVIGVCFFMFSKMSKSTENEGNGFAAESAPVGEFAPRSETAPGTQPEGARQESPEAAVPSSPESEESSPSYGGNENGMPSFGHGEEGMPSGGPGQPGGSPGEYGEGPGGDMQEAWLGDDVEATLSAICKKNGIPDGADPLTDVSKLDGRWQVVVYDSSSSEYPLHYQAEMSAAGNDVTLSISDPGQFLQYESNAVDPTGDYSGKADSADNKITAALSNTADDSKTAVELRNIYTSDEGRFAAGVLTGTSSNGDVYIVLFKPRK